MIRKLRMMRGSSKSGHSGREFGVTLLLITGILTIFNSIRIADVSLRDSMVLVANQYANATNLLVANTVLDQKSSLDALRALLDEMVNTPDSKMLYVIIQSPTSHTLLRVGTVPKGEPVKIDAAQHMFAGLQMIDHPVEITKNVLLAHNSVCTLRIGLDGPTYSFMDLVSEAILLIAMICFALISYSRRVIPSFNNEHDEHYRDDLKAHHGFSPRIVTRAEDQAVVEVFGRQEHGDRPPRN